MNRPGPRLLLLGLLALTLGLGFQGSRGLYETTEGRYAEAGREMLETGNWWVPQLDYRPHWTKPPLTYWTIAAGIAVAGPTSLGARLANGLTLPLLVLATAWLGTLLWDTRTGLLAGLVYATSLFPVVAASTISTDLVLTLWEVLAVALYWKAVRVVGGDGSDRRVTPAVHDEVREAGHEAPWVLAFWFVTGLAFLTKGPPALLTLLAVVVFHRIARSRGWRVPRLARPAGLLAFLVVGFGWYLDVVLRTPGLLSYFVGDEVVGRIATDRFGRNPQWYKPLTVYGIPLALGLGGWLVQVGPIRRGLRAGGVRTDSLRGLARGPVRLFLAIWLLLPLGILTVSRSRLPLYVLPFFTVLPLVAARGLTWAFPDDGAGGARDLRRRTAWTAGTMAVLLLFLKAGSAAVPSVKDMSRLYAAVQAAGSTDSLRVVAVDRDALYGLDFYLGGELDRVRTDVSSDAPASMAVYLQRMAEGESDPAASTRVFVARGAEAPVERLLGQAPGVRGHEISSSRGWHAWLVELVPGPSAEGGGTATLPSADVSHDAVRSQRGSEDRHDALF